jgi:peptide/nickel transport system substrate-binding protein
LLLNMKRLRWQLLIVFLSLIAIGILLLGQQPTVLQQVAPIAQPTTGGIYSEGLIGSFGRLNPILDYFNPPDRDVDYLLFSGLIRFDDRGIPQADLAESWGISQDGTVYNFSIRPEAIWHDGEPVTSEDIAFTAELLRQDDTPIPDDIRELWKQVELKPLDQKTLQFILPEPFSPFLDYLAFGILPEHLLDGMTLSEIIASDFNMQPVGTGPYEFDQLLADGGQITGVVLNLFDEYYGEKPFIEQIVFQYFPDASAAMAAYKAGEIMGISRITTEILPEALAEPELNVYTGRLPQISIIFLNHGDPELPFFQETEIREALLMGLNRQGMVDRLLDGQAFIADGPIFPGTWAYYDGIERVPYDLEGAIAKIREAGYTIPASGGNIRESEGVLLSFELLHPDTEEHIAMAEAIQADWAKLGVAVDLKMVPYEELIEDYLEPRTYQAALVDINLAQTPDPDPYPFWDQAQITGGQNYSQWDDRQASEYLERARITVDLGERTKEYGNFQVRFMNEMPALPLLYPVYSYAVDSTVQGVRMGPLFDTSSRFATIPSWFLVARRAPETEIVPSATP